jgi:hypothetical protein
MPACSKARVERATPHVVRALSQSRDGILAALRCVRFNCVARVSVAHTGYPWAIATLSAQQADGMRLRGTKVVQAWRE